MSTLPSGTPFSQDPPINSVTRAAVTVPLGGVSHAATEDSQEEWQSRLRSLEQWVCELLVKNQQLRWALMEMKGRQSMANTKEQQ
jgi:hypothetical protein